MYLVFDVGGTFVKYALLSMDGNIHEKHKMPTRNKKGDKLEDFVGSLVEIYDRYKTEYTIEGIAMSLPGQVDVDNGIVYGGGALPYLDGIEFADLMSKRCDNLKVSLENDGKCAAHAEIWLGNAKDCNDACVLVFGTGIGGAIIKDRHVHRGKHLHAGEVSYAIDGMTRDEIEYLVKIGEHEFTEEDKRRPIKILAGTCSTAALVRNVAFAKDLPEDQVNGELIYKWANEGDKVCQDILEDLYFEIAKECIRLYVTFDPEIILIGGGISAQPQYIEGIRKYCKEISVISKMFDHMVIDVCKFGSDSNLLGALHNFIQKYEFV